MDCTATALTLMHWMAPNTTSGSAISCARSGETTGRSVGTLPPVGRESRRRATTRTTTHNNNKPTNHSTMNHRHQLIIMNHSPSITASAAFVASANASSPTVMRRQGCAHHRDRIEININNQPTTTTIDAQQQSTININNQQSTHNNQPQHQSTHNSNLKLSCSVSLGLTKLMWEKNDR